MSVNIIWRVWKLIIRYPWTEYNALNSISCRFQFQEDNHKAIPKGLEVSIWSSVFYWVSRFEWNMFWRSEGGGQRSRWTISAEIDELPRWNLTPSLCSDGRKFNLSL